MVLSRSCYVLRFPISVSRPLIIAILFAATLVVHVTHAQTADTQTTKAKSSPSMDVSLGMFGQFTTTRTYTEGYGVQGIYTSIGQRIQGTTNSAGVLGTLHQSFRPWLGYSVNLGYSRFSEEYAQASGITLYNPPRYGQSSYTHGSIGVNMYEVTGSYLVQSRHTSRLDTFAQLGAGVLTFLPTQDPSPYWVMVRRTMVFGTGINYKFSKHWALRAEYRGLFYKNPDFMGASTNVPTTKFFNITNEPTISIVCRFGGKR